MSRSTSFNPLKGFASLKKWLGVGALREVKTEDEEQRYKPIEWPLIKRLFGELWPYRARYAVGITLGICMTICDMSGPQFMRRLIDLCTGYVRHTLPGNVTEHQAIVRAALIMLVWACFATAALIFQRYTIFAMTRAGEYVQFGLRKKLFGHLQRLSMSFYDKTKLGRIISRTTSDVNAMREVNVWGMHIVLVNTLMMCVSAIMLSYTDWRLFLSVAWLAPVLWCLNRIYRTRAGYMWQVVREGYTRVSTNLAENITGMRVVAAYNRQGANLGTFNALQDVNTVNNIAAARINGIYQPLLEVVRVIGRMIILAYGGYLVVRGRIGGTGGATSGIGAVIAAYLYWDWFMNPIVAFGTFENQLMLAMASAERVFNLLDTPPDVQDVPGAIALPHIHGRVEFENVTFSYVPNRPVLHDVSFVAEPGQMVALVGATGSGKSSMVSLIARFYQPQQGRVLVDGQDIRSITGQSLNEQTGLVLQVNYLFTGTVMENIRYAKPSATDEEVIAAARAIGSYDAIGTLQDGFQTQVGERGANMSLGQRQLICFTRAFLADPRIFMLDEATSAVDTGTEVIVQESLEKLLAGRTTFIVAHRLSTIMRADMILVVDDGRIIERGTHRELITANGKYAHLYRQFVMQNE